jgi:glycosyltransferase involved in cell wall biosynthesis
VATVDSGQRSFAHVSFHSMEDGQAAAVHVRELYDALERGGWAGLLVTRERCRRKRLLGYAYVLLHAMQLVAQVDVLYVRAHPAALPLLILARRRRTLAVVEVNGVAADLTDVYPSLACFRWAVALLDRGVLRLADAAIAVSPGLADWVACETRGRVPTAVIPNAADRHRFSPKAAVRTDLPKPYVAYCGALAPWQGLETLLKAAESPHWPAGVSLVVAGEGQMREDICFAARSGSSVHYLGPLKHEDIPAVLAGSVAAISARTRRHASPVKLYEALACGVPVVASAVPGQVELVESHECGLIFPPGDAPSLARAVKLLATRDDVRGRLADNANRASEGHDWDSRAAALMAFVGSLRQGRDGLSQRRATAARLLLGPARPPKR